jgi:hypothetical protein
LLTEFTCLEIRGAVRPRFRDAPFWRQNWAHITRLRRLRRLELTGSAEVDAWPTLPTLAGLAALTALTALNLRQAFCVQDMPQDGDFFAPFPDVCTLDLTELAQLPFLACNHG